MLIDSIVDFCNEKFISTQCSSCSYTGHCPNDCARCLHYIHTPTCAPEKRTYDCSRMACYYVCKYSHKYASELVYAFEQMKDLKKRERINVMSIGCGPSTELFALDYLKRENVLSFKNLEYRGVDLNPLWKDVHSEIIDKSPKEYMVKYYYDDIFDLMDIIFEKNWIPDLTVFQYVFSDMQKNSDISEIKTFIQKFADFFNDKMKINSYVVLNDINLSVKYNGGREYFDRLRSLLSGCEDRKYHFDNSNKDTHYDYYDEYECNDLVFRIPNKLNMYDPFDSCASAQMIIKKVK